MANQNVEINSFFRQKIKNKKKNKKMEFLYSIGKMVNVFSLVQFESKCNQIKM